MRIFITGFQRSGTTLLRRLIDMHPQVSCMIHEKHILKQKTKENVLKKAYTLHPVIKENSNKSWGEKIPWASQYSSNILKYCDKWNKIFVDEEPILLHIIRNPLSVALSNQKRKWLSVEGALKNWKQSISSVLTYFDNIPNGRTFVYEELVSTPYEVLTEIFKFCRLDFKNEIIQEIQHAKKENLRYFDQIEASRAFSFQEFEKNIDNQKIIDDYKILIKPYLVGNFNF